LVTARTAKFFAGAIQVTASAWVWLPWPSCLPAAGAGSRRDSFERDWKPAGSGAGASWWCSAIQPTTAASASCRPSGWGLGDEYGGGAAFQALELRAGLIPTAGALVRYAPEFAALTSEEST